MTGGQMAPTTEIGVITTTSSKGKGKEFGPGFKGPETVRGVANKDAYIARASVSNPVILRNTIKKAIESQTEKNNFSFVEVLSICPTNWKTSAHESLKRVKEMEEYYPLGEI